MSGKRGPRLLRVVAATAFTLIGSAATGAAADTTPDQPADLSVTVLGGGTPTDEHSAIDYTIELRNDGHVAYRHLAVSALLPSGFHVVHTSPAAPASALPTWTVDLGPGQRLDISARITAGTVQDLAEGTSTPLAAGAANAADTLTTVADASAPGAEAWYSVTACVRRTPADPPVTCGLSSQLLVKTDDDTRRGIETIVLLLGIPAVVAALGAYAWRARRDPDTPSP